jgi:FkbM family methyltransferase
MNPIFSDFLYTLANSGLHTAYTLLPEKADNAVDEKIASELRSICTSHFIRQRSSKFNALFNLKQSGFTPSIVFDVGAQVGTPELYSAFPEAHHVFIEPVEECIPVLNEIASKLKSADVLNCAVSNVSGRATLSLTDSRQYSSIETKIGNDKREIEVKTVDSIYDDIQIDGPVLLKIDVDGIEIKVLEGADSILRGDCIVVIEASIADENPRFSRVVDFMSGYGYKVYDIVDPLYRLSDWHLWQVDLIFVKTTSSTWGPKTYS